jgi:mRNA interferase HigB
VHVISFRLLRDFALDYPLCLEPLKAWHKIAGTADWRSIAEVRLVYPHADAVGNCTVFNIKGNEFRLVVRIDYGTQVIYTKKVMTHAEYSKKQGQWQKSCGC